jgi:hypothetical protein
MSVEVPDCIDHLPPQQAADADAPEPPPSPRNDHSPPQQAADADADAPEPLPSPRNDHSPPPQQAAHADASLARRTSAVGTAALLAGGGRGRDLRLLEHRWLVRPVLGRQRVRDRVRDRDTSASCPPRDRRDRRQLRQCRRRQRPALDPHQAVRGSATTPRSPASTRPITSSRARTSARGARATARREHAGRLRSPRSILPGFCLAGTEVDKIRLF